jgi:hypothetical protein
MKKLVFPYILLKGQYYPIIPISLKKGKKSILTTAIVDSGATVSLFQGSIAEHLGIDVESGERKLFQGVGGKIVGYIHTLILGIENYEFTCKVAFSYELTTSLNMLGRYDVFDKFLVIFDDKNKKLILKIL